MKKIILISATAAMYILFSVLFVSCPSGLDPSWKNNNKPIFSLDFSNSSLSDGAGSRALVQGGGFLYIRTVGSATGIKGSFYGPYTVLPGKKFSTTEIPAGSYTGLAVIYSATKANTESISWNGKTYTFLELMNLPDAEFMKVVDAGEETEEFKMEEFFDSDASGNMTPNVIITAGQENIVKLTLEPMVRAENKKDFEVYERDLQHIVFPLESETVKKQFFALENVPAGTFSYTTSYDERPVTIANTALYDWRGNFLKTWDSAESLETPNSFELPPDLENKDLYFYIEYSGEITLTFSVTPPPLVYYVSDLGSGNFTGSSVDNTMSLDAAFDAIASNSASNYLVYITENVIYTPRQSNGISVSLCIQSLGETSHTIRLQNFIYQNPFNIVAGGVVTLENLIVDGLSSTGMQVPAFNVALGGYLTLENTTISNIHNIDSSGGAIAVLGGNVIINASTITNCSAIQGAGIYMVADQYEESSVLFDEASFITYCETINGGSGGGVFIGKNGFFVLGSGTISNCSAPSNNGGGFFIDNDGILDLGSGPYSITQNTALYGGGIFASPSAAIQDNYTNLDTYCINNTATNPEAGDNIYRQEP